MKALISGQAAVGVLWDDDRLFSFSWDDPELLVPRHPGDLRLLFGTATDLVELQTTSHAQAIDSLGKCWRKDRAVHMALILLDEDAATDTRAGAAECLDEFLAEPPTEQAVTNLLAAAPLPARSDLAGAIVRAETGGLGRVASWLRALESSQPAVQFVRSGWNALPLDLFANVAGTDPSSIRREIEGVATRYGVFRRLVEAGEDSARVKAVLTYCNDLEPELNRQPGAVAVLRRWIEGLLETVAGRKPESQEEFPSLQEASWLNTVARRDIASRFGGSTDPSDKANQGFDVAGSPRNALFLAEACNLAYIDEPEAASGFRRQLGMEARVISSGNTRVYVCQNDKAVVVAFRGSEVETSLEELKDWLLTNANNYLIVPEGQSGTDFAAAGAVRPLSSRVHGSPRGRSGNRSRKPSGRRPSRVTSRYGSPVTASERPGARWQPGGYSVTPSR